MDMLKSLKLKHCQSPDNVGMVFSLKSFLNLSDALGATCIDENLLLRNLNCVSSKSGGELYKAHPMGHLPREITELLDGMLCGLPRNLLS